MGKETVKDVVGNLHAFQIIVKVSPDWICAVTSRFTKLFYCEGANIAHIQSGDTFTSSSISQLKLVNKFCNLNIIKLLM